MALQAGPVWLPTSGSPKSAGDWVKGMEGIFYNAVQLLPRSKILIACLLESLITNLKVPQSFKASFKKPHLP